MRRLLLWHVKVVKAKRKADAKEKAAVKESKE